ncbi:MAG: hypothetical protein K9N05_02170 [Candidatus Marinimicrobia bacterium]|nr:hypothetical protein [Candidatus Neomarinimicrobiota bacterium]
MKKYISLLILSLLIAASVYAYDSTLVFSQYFGNNESKTQSMLGEYYIDYLSSGGNYIHVSFIPIHDDLNLSRHPEGIRLYFNEDWKINLYKTYLFNEMECESGLTHKIIENELAYLKENGWHVSKEIKNKEYDRTEYILKRGDWDKIEIRFINSWNFSVEQNIKTSWELLFE